MNAFFFGIILFSAFLHAAWNAIVKGGNNTILTTVLVTVSGLFLKERIGTTKVVGSCLIVTGVIVLRLASAAH